ncbi:Domain found in DishevelledEgl-10and Pleckstrin family protein [Aphelenchoides avenae]|nr:Domain found in DishevelledEgl-10and Pleckstrin family protein [Aphelenchus avenae]
MDTEGAPLATPAPAEQPEKTKVYYHIDNVDDQYRVDVPLPLAQLTLAAVRPYLSHSRNAKFYLVVWEEEINKHVKQAILDENEPLRPDANGRIELFLESDAEPAQCNAAAAHSKRSSMRFSKSDMRQRPPPPPQTYGRRYAAYEDSSQDESSAFASNVRALSDDDSQYSTDFTSVSQQQQRHKPYRRRRARRTRPSRASTFLSSTFDDTEISMALDLLTISLRLDPKEPLGLSVVVHKSNGCEGIYVHNVEPNSVVGRDGRITPGSAILEVDDLPLDAYDGAEALDILKAHVKRATEARGILKLTLSQTQGDYRAYPFGGLGLGRVRQEPVRPIDPEAWVKHVDAMRRLNVIPEDSENVMSPHGRAASRQSLQLPPKRPTMGDHHAMAPPPAMPAHMPPPVPRPQPTCGWPSSGVGSSIASSAASGPAPAAPQKRFSVHGTDRLEIVRAMAEPGSGLDVRDRTWLNMPMEKSFVGHGPQK